MQGLLQGVRVNRYGNEELRIEDGNGGSVTVIKNSRDLRHVFGKVGMVSSWIHDGIGGTNDIKTVDDVEDSIEGIKRINRISDSDKEDLIAFLETFRGLVK